MRAGRILIVGDRVDPKLGMDAILAGAGHCVYRVDPGIDPLLYAFSVRPDVVLAQVASLAGRSLRAATLFARSRALPVILESELASFELEAALTDGLAPAMILYHPVSCADLLAAVDLALQAHPTAAAILFP